MAQTAGTQAPTTHKASVTQTEPTPGQGLSARVGEVPVLKARIQPFGQGDQLIDGVMLQGGRRVHVVSRLHPAGLSE